MFETLPALLKERASSIGERPAVIYQDTPITYRELENKASRFARALYEVGIRRGDHVAIMLNNCPEFVISYFACCYLGAVAVPVNIFFKERELSHLLHDSDTAALIVNPAFASVYEQIAEKPPQLKHLIFCGENPEGLSFERMLSNTPDSPLEPESDPGDTAEILYTSGTTGEPKGVMLTHRNLLFHAGAIIEVLNLSDDDRALMVIPMFHGYGVTVMLCSFFCGSSFVLLDPFNPAEVFESIEKHRITFLPMVVAMYNFLYHYPDRDQYDLSSLRIGISGASAMPGQLMRDCSDAFNIKIIEAWGLTECSASATIQRPDLPYKEGSVGLPHPGVEVAVMGDAGNLLGPGEVGELVIKGPLVMKGYYKKPEETEQALQHGWLHSGDMGYYDRDGYFFMVDRKKELINIGGEKVFPREVEEILFQHPAVLEAALVPIPHDALGEVPVAAVVLDSGVKVGEDELTGYLGERLAKFKVPRRIVFMDSLPRSPIGKVKKKELIQMLAE